MTPPTDVHAVVRSDSRGKHYIITDSDSLDDAQVSGRWLKTTTPVENTP